MKPTILKHCAGRNYNSPLMQENPTNPYEKTQKEETRIQLEDQMKKRDEERQNKKREAEKAQMKAEMDKRSAARRDERQR